MVGEQPDDPMLRSGFLASYLRQDVARPSGASLKPRRKPKAELEPYPSSEKREQDGKESYRECPLRPQALYRPGKRKEGDGGPGDQTRQEFAATGEGDRLGPVRKAHVFENVKETPPGLILSRTPHSAGEGQVYGVLQGTATVREFHGGGKGREQRF
jgi:hypothetical protein